MTLAKKFCAAWQNRSSLDELLFELVAATGSRAAGCWRLEGRFLELIGFGWASDMPKEISQGFQDTTRRVSLDQTGLGIVRAATTQEPAIALRDPTLTGLDGSASWIVKFDANSSLAVPILEPNTNRFIGVFAVSTAATIAEGDSFWRTLVDLSNEIGRSVSSSEQ